MRAISSGVAVRSCTSSGPSTAVRIGTWPACVAKFSSDGVRSRRAKYSSNVDQSSGTASVIASIGICSTSLNVSTT